MLVKLWSVMPRLFVWPPAMSRDQLHDSRSLLALQVEGQDLSGDHGYPARIIVPALPGVHNTRWVERLTFS